MKVLFDSQMFYRQRYGGITRYFSNLIHYLEDTEGLDCKLSLVASNNEYIRSYPKLINGEAGNDFVAKWPKLTNNLNRLLHSKELLQGNYDVFHPTYYHPYFLKYVRKPYIVTVHDMVHELYPQYFSPKDKTVLKKKRIITNAAQIIAISENTKKDILRFYDIAPEKITVVYHGHSYLSLSKSEQEDKDETTDNTLPKYILFVGQRGGYKNFDPFLQAISALLNREGDLNLICLGGGEFSKDEENLISLLGVKRQVHQFDVSDSSIYSLYKKALFFVFPSQYEGFGLPILEAFEAMCPVAVSNTSSFPEVGGDAVRYFDPFSLESMTTCFDELYQNETLRKELSRKGIQQLSLFNIEDCCRKTVEIYKRAIESYLIK